MKQLMKISLILSLCGCTALKDVFSPITEADKKILEESSLNFEPLPEVSTNDSEISKARIDLGRKLYLDPTLSVNNQVSCNSCHQLQNYGVDNVEIPVGHKGKNGTRNTPSTFNAFLYIAQFWDGRARDVEEQALMQILDPVHMGYETQNDVVKKIDSIMIYKDSFKKAFPTDQKPIKFRNIGIAIGAFERTLVTPSRFDQFLRGDIRALSKTERSGLNTFTQVGCVSCHNGVAVGGGMYQKLGAAEEYPNNDDLGLYEITRNEDDKYFFKVPSLRNVAQTGPWFHDGSIKTLETAVRVMGRYQLGIELKETEVEEISAFLKSLTGDIPQSVSSY